MVPVEVVRTEYSLANPERGNGGLNLGRSSTELKNTISGFGIDVQSSRLFDILGPERSAEFPSERLFCATPSDNLELHNGGTGVGKGAFPSRA